MYSDLQNTDYKHLFIRNHLSLEKIFNKTNWSKPSLSPTGTELKTEAYNAYIKNKTEYKLLTR